MKFTQEEISKRIRRREKISKLIYTAIYMILIPIFIYNVMVLVSLCVETEETPSVFGIKTYIIASGSMEPTLNIGDIVIVKEVNENDIKVGDIISYKSNADTITHRVKEINIQDNQKKFVTMGDNNNVEDNEIINIQKVEGKVINTIKYLGNIYLFFKQKGTIFVFIMLYFIYYHITNKRKYLARKKRKIIYQEANL